MNFYEILGVTPDSDLSEIKSAYRKLVRLYHPDVNPQGGKKFKEISKAYDTLSDPAKKNQYDTLNVFFKSAKSDINDNIDNNSSSNAETPIRENCNNSTDKSFREKYFSGLFESVLSSKSASKSSEKLIPKDGTDINVDVTVSFKDSRLGCNRVVNVVCSELCPRCKGRKFINGTKCPVCSGTGEYLRHKRIKVKIPKGIKNATKLRIKGEGTEGSFGGKNGDLFVKVFVKSDDRIQYDGLDILYSIPISPFEAVLGADVSVNTLDGIIKLKIPPKTSSGQKFRLNGLGLNKNGKSGDIIVTVSIEIPNILSDDEIKLYEKLKNISAYNVRENLFNE